MGSFNSLSIAAGAAAIAGSLCAGALHADDPTPGYNTKFPKGSLTPDKYPTGWADNWIETVPGKGFFAIQWLYSQTEPWSKNPGVRVTLN